MASAPVHDYCAYGADEEAGRAEKQGDDEEHGSSAIEKAPD